MQIKTTNLHTVQSYGYNHNYYILIIFVFHTNLRQHFAPITLNSIFAPTVLCNTFKHLLTSFNRLLFGKCRGFHYGQGVLDIQNLAYPTIMIHTSSKSLVCKSCVIGLARPAESVQVRVSRCFSTLDSSRPFSPLFSAPPSSRANRGVMDVVQKASPTHLMNWSVSLLNS